MHRITSIGIVLVTIIGAILMGGKFSYFIDIPSIIFVLLIIIGMHVGKHGFQWKAESYKTIYKSGLIAGVLGFAIGVVQMGQHLASPSSLGTALGVAMLTLVYGFSISAISFALAPKS